MLLILLSKIDVNGKIAGVEPAEQALYEVSPLAMEIRDTMLWLFAELGLRIVQDTRDTRVPNRILVSRGGWVAGCGRTCRA